VTADAQRIVDTQPRLIGELSGAGRLRCPHCGYQVWTSDDGASCTDPDYASGFRPVDRACGATWDADGTPATPPREEYAMRNYTLTTGDDQPRGEVRATRADAVAAANAIGARTGEKVYVAPAGARVEPAPQTRSRR
jgi:hypothetical protein